MLLEVRVNNFYIFENEVIFSLKANMHTKKFSCNVFANNHYNILKSVGVYGSNNSGKTSLFRSISSIKAVLGNNIKSANIMPNIFSGSSIVELAVVFMINGKVYDYAFKYDAKKGIFKYEELVVLSKDIYGNEKAVSVFKRDFENKIYDCVDEKIKNILPLLSKDNILFYLIEENTSEFIKEIKADIVNFVDKIEVIDMNNIPIKKTVNLLKNKGEIREKTVEFILKADLALEDIDYVESNFEMQNQNFIYDENLKPQEKAIIEQVNNDFIDQFKLMSKYNGVTVPSLIFDSTGTKKIAALASYIVESLEQGKILVIDELDNSLHYRLTRAIVSMYNSELNENAQLIFSVHDIGLMDCKKMFRKEQIWFIDRSKDEILLYSLAEFTANDGVRDTTDVVEKYKKGLLGAVPEPDLISVLFNIEI